MSAAAAAAAAEESLVRELKRHHQDMKLMLWEEKKMREKLGRERTMKMREIASVEAAIAMGREKHNEELQEVVARGASNLTALGESIKALQAEKSELEADLGSWEVSSATNDRLRQEVCAARREADEEARALEREEERVRASTTNMRMDLESVTRHTLRKVDVEYEKKARDDLRREADGSDDTNRRLADSLAQRAAVATHALDKQSERARRLRDARVERELLTEAKGSHDARFAKIRHSLQRADALAASRQADVAKMHVALRKAQHENASLRDGLKRLDELARRLNDARAVAHRRRDRALRLAQVICQYALDQGRRPAVPEEMSHLSPADDVSCVTSSGRRHPLSPNATTRGPEDDDINHAALLPDHSTSRQPGARGPAAFSDLDLLRMWNSNYA